ncbi:MAG: type 1 glutamine amidotransferase [Deltaproteobacteria bacterium]|nr:type 1 glutamine amidotransferase [Deltaproteobacteria bacterium]
MIRVAILVEDLYEDMELQYPLYRLQEEGFKVDIVGTERDVEYKGKHGYPTKSGFASNEVKADDYDAVVIPGGYSPDRMRRCPATVEFVRQMDKKKKLIAAICHGPWMMASCCNLRGKKITGFFSIKDDLLNAGADFVDEEVVVCENLITSRTPEDLIAFTKKIIKALKNR